MTWYACEAKVLWFFLVVVELRQTYVQECDKWFYCFFFLIPSFLQYLLLRWFLNSIYIYRYTVAVYIHGTLYCVLNLVHIFSKHFQLRLTLVICRTYDSVCQHQLIKQIHVRMYSFCTTNFTKTTFYFPYWIQFVVRNVACCVSLFILNELVYSTRFIFNFKRCLV